MKVSLVFVGLARACARRWQTIIGERLAQTIGDPRYLWAASALGKAMAQILEAQTQRYWVLFPNKMYASGETPTWRQLQSKNVGLT